MSRPRIRSIKPENWEDEHVGRLSRDARLLRDVLITFADDDGRWRHLPSAIIGHGYPYDEDVTPARIKKWTAELVREELVVIYDIDGHEYGCFPKWHLHQNINRYTPSKLPPCDDPDVVTRDEALHTKAARAPRNVSATSVRSQGAVAAASSPHAQARGSWSGSLPDPDPQIDARARIAALHPKLSDVLAILEPLQGVQVEAASIDSALKAHPRKDPVAAAHKVASIVQAGQNRTVHINSLLMSILERAPDAPADDGEQSVFDRGDELIAKALKGEF